MRSSSAGSLCWRRHLTTLAPTAPEAGQVEEAPAVRLSGIRRVYGDVVAVAGIDLDIGAGEFFTLLRPSGSGKTTTLRVIAGFERPDAGRVELQGVDVTRVAPAQRAVNTVFQDYALFPHMTVAENVEYGLRVKGMGRRDRRTRALDVLERVRLPGLGDRKPVQLSGGQRQRVQRAGGYGAARRAPARIRHRPAGPSPRRAAGRARPEAAPGDADLPQS